MAGKRYELGDQEKLAFGIDWSDFLTGENATIAASSWTVPAGLTVVQETTSTTATVVVVEVDTGEIGDTFLITNEITLSDAYAQEAERSFTIKIVETKYK